MRWHSVHFWADMDEHFGKIDSMIEKSMRGYTELMQE